MKRLFIVKTASRCLLICATLSILCAADALAAESAGFTRADWDMIMRWVNFIILAVLIIKYARKPLTDFLYNKKDEMARLIEKYESRKQEAEAKILESQNLLAESEKRLKTIEERIIAQGERRKAQTIEAARTESHNLLETAQEKIEGQLREAHSQLKAEIIDSATRKAMAKLPAVITGDDQDQLIHQWLEAARQ